ncbi:MAG: metallophosphoesterase, partial [Clostridia bacterium]|nr:metallophosphoesterase [Clostridia bacterium]
MIYLYIGAGVVAFLALCALFVWFNNSCIKKKRVKRTIEGAPKLKIVHLSDLHGKRFGHKNIKLIKNVADEKPDFIAFTGDIIHLYTPKNIAVACETVSALKEIAPVLFIAGNHEMRNKGYRNLRKILIDAGATVLDDKCAEVCGITVAGLNGASLRNDKIEKITPEISPKILLAHEPQFFEKYMGAGYDL